MPRCIYCQEEKDKTAYQKVEHVMPQSFGRFKDNLTLKEIVCDACNKYFGDTLELPLARGSWEGWARFLHGAKKPEEYKTLGKKSRLIIKVGEGPMKGAFGFPSYCEKQNKIVLNPAEQIGFLKKADSQYDYFLLDEIPDKAYLDANGYDLASPQGIIVLTNLTLAEQRLKEKNIPFKPSPNKADEIVGGLLTSNVEWTSDQIITRAIAKIAFNYLTYWQGPAFALLPDFNILRDYIRHGKKPPYPLMIPINTPILGDEPVEGARRLGHIVTTSWADDGVSIMSRIALFNDITYCISLVRNFSGEKIDITRGHFFNTNPEQMIIVPIEKNDRRH